MEVQGFQCEVCDRMRTKQDGKGERWWVIFVTNNGVHLVPFELSDKAYKEMMSRDAQVDVTAEYHLCSINHMYDKLKHLIKEETDAVRG